jgi:hypothetical protein
MRIVLVLINLLALIGAILWGISAPDWEPLVTSIALFGALVTQILTSDEIKSKIKLKLKSKKDSHNYQAGGNQTITDNKKVLKGGENSENYQAELVVVNKGLTYDETKSIALDVYRSNMMEFKSIAEAVASERAEEITEKILDKISEQDPRTLMEFQSPGMQDALFRTQKEYAISGDKDIGDLLVDILSDRAKTPKRNMLQLVLDESLSVAPKITVEQLDTLTLNFLLIKTRRLTIKNFEDFKTYLQNHIYPFVENLVSDSEHYNFLEYLRCGQIRAGSFGQLEQNLRKTYKGVFSKGFTKEELEQEFEDTSKIKVKIIPCFHDNSKLQLGVMDDEVLETQMEQFKVDEQIRPKIKSFYEKTTMSNKEIKELLEGLDNNMKKVFEVWKDSYFKNFDLSSMGIAIAHANYRRKTNETMDLSIWIK